MTGRSFPRYMTTSTRGLSGFPDGASLKDLFCGLLANATNFPSITLTALVETLKSGEVMSVNFIVSVSVSLSLSLNSLTDLSIQRILNIVKGRSVNQAGRLTLLPFTMGRCFVYLGHDHRNGSDRLRDGGPGETHP